RWIERDRGEHTWRDGHEQTIRFDYFRAGRRGGEDTNSARIVLDSYRTRAKSHASAEHCRSCLWKPIRTAINPSNTTGDSDFNSHACGKCVDKCSKESCEGVAHAERLLHPRRERLRGTKVVKSLGHIHAIQFGECTEVEVERARILFPDRGEIARH